MKLADGAASEGLSTIETVHEASPAPLRSADDEDTCVICMTSAEPLLTGCGHRFCADCVKRYASMHSTRPGCPMCKVPIADDVLSLAGCEVDLIELFSAAHEEAPRVDVNRERLEFRRAARAAHMRRCPGCSAPIVKDGGCNHMRCAVCSLRFNWSSVPLIVPCRCLNFGKPLVSVKLGAPRTVNICWAVTCPGCTPETKLAALGINSLVLGGAITYGVGWAAKTAATAVAFKPLARACRVSANLLKDTAERCSTAHANQALNAGLSARLATGTPLSSKNEARLLTVGRTAEGLSATGHVKELAKDLAAGVAKDPVSAGRQALQTTLRLHEAFPNVVIGCGPQPT